MPELPEVETIRRDLEKKIVSKKIQKLEIKDSAIIKNSQNQFVKKLKGYFFSRINRIGKLLIFQIPNNDYLLVHLKMTGQLVFCDQKTCVAGGHSMTKEEDISGIGELPNKYTRVIFTFSDKSKLYFNDLRKFGYLKIVNEDELNLVKETFGIEPLTKNFTLDNFKKIFKNRKTNIKALLLNQKLIAGIGNIYADEILFDVGILPTRPVDKVAEAEIKKIFKSTQKIIKKAIQYRGTTFNSYRDGSGKKGNFKQFLKVYGRKGEKCIKCKKATIKKEKIAQRGTSYCPVCQK